MNLFLNFVKSLAPRINFNPPEMICFSTLMFGQALQLTSQTQFSSQNSLPSLSLLESSTYSLLCMQHILYTCLHSAAAAVKSFQSCPTLCDPIDGSPPGSSVPGILQARTLEWVAISSSNACMHAKSLQSCPTLCDPTDGSPPGSSVPGILQARTLEWVAISFSNA